MRPSHSIEQAQKGLSIDPRHSSESPAAHSLLGVKGTKFANLRLRQLGGGVGCTSVARRNATQKPVRTNNPPGAAFGYHVSNIIDRSPQEEMGRVDASWIVAPVQNHQVWRHRGAMLKFIGEAVREPLPVPAVYISLDQAVASVVLGREPLPAVTCAPLIDLLPKALSKSQVSVAGHSSNVVGKRRLHKGGV